MARAATSKNAGAYPAKIIRPEAGNISEIYSAIQGEGTFVGERHLFIRLSGCPFRCFYCDTPEALVPSATCRIETPPGSRKFTKQPNPIQPQTLKEAAGTFLTAGSSHRAIALTGGEPLWQAEYLKLALPLLREFRKPIYLETAGVHVEELKSILSLVDIVAMDMKPASSTSMKPLWAQHREFLKVALVKRVVVKIIVTRTTMPSDLEQARDIIAEVDRTVPVVLQPATPAWKVKKGPTPQQLLLWQNMMSGKLDEVRVIPQCHKLLGER